MSKVLKRVAVVLMTVIMMVVMLPVQSVKAEEDTYTVYVQVPDGWGAPYIWAWGSPRFDYSRLPGIYKHLRF